MPVFITTRVVKVKATPVQTWTSPGGSRRLRLPYFIYSRLMKVPYAPSAFTLQDIFLVLISVRG